MNYYYLSNFFLLTINNRIDEIRINVYKIIIIESGDVWVTKLEVVLDLKDVFDMNVEEEVDDDVVFEAGVVVLEVFIVSNIVLLTLLPALSITKIVTLLSPSFKFRFDPLIILLVLALLLI